MLYVKVIKGVPTEVLTRPNWFADNGPVTDAELIGLGIYPLDRTIPEYDPVTHSVSENPAAEWKVHSDKVAVTYRLVPLAANEVRENLARYAAAKRHEREVGGTVWNGWPVATDRESQGKIMAEILAIDRGERLDGDGWKFNDGVFRALTNQQMSSLSIAVRKHVRDSFALEATTLAQIDAGTIITSSEVDRLFANGP